MLNVAHPSSTNDSWEISPFEHTWMGFPLSISRALQQRNNPHIRLYSCSLMVSTLIRQASIFDVINKSLLFHSGHVNEVLSQANPVVIMTITMTILE